MSDRYTSINLVGSPFPGLAEYGRLSKEEMIKQYREYGKRLREEADLIESASDECFTIETYVGFYVRKKREVIQEGKNERSV